MSNAGLRSLVNALRDEIAGAKEDAENSTVKFAVGEVTVDLEFTVQSATSANAGIKPWIFDFGVSAKDSNTNTHKISLTLTPYEIDPNTGERKNLAVSDTGESRRSN